MRHPIEFDLVGNVTSASLVIQSSPISGFQAARGTISGVSTTGSPPVTTLTYTPNIREPRWPEFEAFDGFSYSGVDENGIRVVGIVHIKIFIERPDDRIISSDLGGANVDDVDTTAVTSTAVAAVAANYPTNFGNSAPLGGNSLSSNPIDGIVFSRPPTANSLLNWWDPVPGPGTRSGTIDLSVYDGYSTTMDATGGAAYDADNELLWLFGDPNGTSEPTVWAYMVSFEPYETGTTPVVKSVEQVFIYADYNANTGRPGTNLTNLSFGDVAYDTISKRIYMVDTDGNPFGYIYPDDLIRRNIGGVRTVYQAWYDIGSTAPAAQIAFNWDCSTLYGLESGTGTGSLWRIDPVIAGGPTVTNLGAINEVIDAATWPVTLPT